MVKKISLAAASTIVCLLLAEIVVRVLGLAPGISRIRVDMPHGSFESSPNEVLRYVPRPGSPAISAYGIRDRDYPLARQSGGQRVVVIGDSVCYGFCNDRQVLAVESVFPKQLERMLQETAAEPVEVINLCVSGYDTVQEVEFLVQKGLALQPDIVIVAYCLNDDFDASAELMRFRADPQFGIDSAIAQRLVLRSHLARLIWVRHWQPPPAAQQQEAVSRTERGFQRLAALAREHGFQPVVVVFPLFERAAEYRWGPFHRRVAQIAARHELPLFDLLAPFIAETDGDLPLLQGRCNREHPDERGHRLAAAAIQDFLLSQGFIRKR